MTCSAKATRSELSPAAARIFVESNSVIYDRHASTESLTKTAGHKPSTYGRERVALSKPPPHLVLVVLEHQDGARGPSVGGQQSKPGSQRARKCKGVKRAIQARGMTHSHSPLAHQAKARVHAIFLARETKKCSIGFLFLSLLKHSEFPSWALVHLRQLYWCLGSTCCRWTLIGCLASRKLLGCGPSSDLQ